MRPALALLLAVLPWADVAPHGSPRVALALVTDKTWKSGEPENDAWLSPAFDDSAWATVAEITGPVAHGPHYSVENMFGFASPAKWIWAGDGSDCAMRKSFDVRRGFRRAEMVILADDVAEVRINGELASVWQSHRAIWGHRGGAELIDLAPFLIDGRNAVTAKVHNNGGPAGFAAEIRIDGDPFLFPYRSRISTAGPAAAASLDDIAKMLDEDPTQKVNRRMVGLLERHGAALMDKLRMLSMQGSAPRRAFMASWIGKLAPNIGFAEGLDGRFAFGDWTADALWEQMQSADANRVAVKLLIGARTLGIANEDALLQLLRKSIKEGIPHARDRAVRFIGVLEIVALAPDLAEIVKKDPRSTAGAYAAAALGRIGNQAHLDVLRGTLKCGHGMTERAARRAIDRIGGP